MTNDNLRCLIMVADIGPIGKFQVLGTLGSGNHFVEVCLDTEQNVWIMLHSGSRGLGNKVGMYFIEKAKEEMRRWFVNLPDEADTLTIGVKLELKSRGGSKSMHDDVQVGTVLKATLPQNRFRLQPSNKEILLIAGGIGITPILAMGQALTARRVDFSFQFFVRSDAHVPFRSRLSALSGAVDIKIGLGPEETAAAHRDREGGDGHARLGDQHGVKEVRAAHPVSL